MFSGHTRLTCTHAHTHIHIHIYTYADAPVTIHIGYAETCEGMEDALYTMKKGETSIFTIRSEYGFGAHKVVYVCDREREGVCLMSSSSM